MGSIVELAANRPVEGNKPMAPSTFNKTNHGASKWNAGVVVFTIIGAEMKSAVLVWRLAIDVAETWLDAAHAVATTWRT